MFDEIDSPRRKELRIRAGRSSTSQHRMLVLSISPTVPGTPGSQRDLLQEVLLTPDDGRMLLRISRTKRSQELEATSR